MPDYIYNVRVYADVSFVPRGRPGGVGIQQNNSNIGGYGATQGPGEAPGAQTMRFQQVEYVGNAVATPPTAANIGTAIQTAGTDIQAQITAAVLAQIQNWATGGE
jgi:hypothetical protein